MPTQPEAMIIAASIAALAATLSAVLSWRSAGIARDTTTKINDLNLELQQVLADKTREADLVANALNHLVGGSQERTAGLATLALLKTETPLERWARYEGFVQTLLRTAMIYVLTAGRNRWQAHEIENVREIANWFKKDETWTSEIFSRESRQPLINISRTGADGLTRVLHLRKKGIRRIRTTGQMTRPSTV